MIDYECQLKYNCYLNLANLALHVVGSMLVLMFLIGALSKLLNFVGKICKTLSVFAKFMCCIGICLKKMSMGMLGEEIVYT